MPSPEEKSNILKAMLRYKDLTPEEVSEDNSARWADMQNVIRKSKLTDDELVDVMRRHPSFKNSYGPGPMEDRSRESVEAMLTDPFWVERYPDRRNRLARVLAQQSLPRSGRGDETSRAVRETFGEGAYMDKAKLY